MKLIFKTNTYGFHIEITNPLIARKLKDSLPWDSKVVKYNDSICFNMYTLDVALEDPSLCAKKGDVIWNYSNSSLCIYLGLPDAEQKGTPSKGIKAGRILASADEIRQLNNGDKISVSLLEEKSSYSDGRILSQSEIDSLVKNLLSSKNNK